MLFRTWGVVVLLLLGGCSCHGEDADAGEDAGPLSDGGEDVAHEAGAPSDESACLVGSTTTEIVAQSASKIDIVFMVDDSATMAEEQAALMAQLPRMIEVLTSGDFDDDGAQDFPPVQDLHLGVVSSDLGLSGIDDVPRCSGLGDDGILNNVASPDIAGCSAQTFMPRFLTFSDGDDAEQVATDLGCLAALGTEGCGFEQPLESLLKAVWPQSDTRVNFVPDPSGFGTTGQAGPSAPNGDVLRSDAAAGLSLVQLIVLTGTDDCSSSNTSHFNPSPEPGSPLSMQGLNTRCFFEGQRPEPNNLFDVARYINAFKALREGNEDLVLFAAIVGVPPALVTREQIAKLDFAKPQQSDAFYDGLLAAPEMQERIDDRGTPDPSDDDILPSCLREGVAIASPPRRIVEVAKGFGANGLVQSICQDDFRDAIDVILSGIVGHLGAPCLPTALERDSEGLIACDVIWELPAPGSAPASAPVSCAQLPFLTDLEQLSSSGGARCKVEQRAVIEGTPAPGNGWFYDDFSDELSACASGAKQRIAFTTGAQPPAAVRVQLACVAELPSSDDAQDDDRLQCTLAPQLPRAHDVGNPCLTHAVPEGGFEASEGYIETRNADCGGGVCLVYRLDGDPGPDCVPDGQSSCPTPAEIEERVYCSCRCDAPDGFDECQCRNGYSCVDLLRSGSDEVRGGYCVRDTFGFD